MADDVSERDFVQGNRSGAYGRSTRTGTKQCSAEEKNLMKGARALLFKQLRDVPLTGGKLCGDIPRTGSDGGCKGTVVQTAQGRSSHWR